MYLVMMTTVRGIVLLVAWGGFDPGFNRDFWGWWEKILSGDRVLCATPPLLSWTSGVPYPFDPSPAHWNWSKSSLGVA